MGVLTNVEPTNWIGEKAPAAKRKTKPGQKRVMVTLGDDEYKDLVKIAEQEMREPNNMLSFMLRGNIANMLEEYDKSH